MVNQETVKTVLSLRDEAYTREAIAAMTNLTPEQVKYICSSRYKKEVKSTATKSTEKEVKIFPTSPISRLKKAEIVWLANHRCRHRHSYLEHYACYLEEQKPDPKIGFLDIETSNLKADFGILLCYCIKEAGKNNILSGVITQRDLQTNLDKRVVKKCIDDMKKFDRLVTYYGSNFDLPFLRSRALSLGLPFPGYGEIFHTDAYYIARSKLCLSSKRLENVSRVILGETEKTRIDSKHWIKALQGNKAALNYILDHCKRDVKDLERVYDKLIGFKKRSDLSI